MRRLVTIGWSVLLAGSAAAEPDMADVYCHTPCADCGTVVKIGRDTGGTTRMSVGTDSFVGVRYLFKDLEVSITTSGSETVFETKPPGRRSATLTLAEGRPGCCHLLRYDGLLTMESDGNIQQLRIGCTARLPQ